MTTYVGKYQKGLGRGAKARLQLLRETPGSFATNVATGKRMRYRRFRPGFDRTGGFYGRYRKEGTPEMKFFDTALTLTFPTAAACSTSNLTGNIHIIAIGDQPNQREGRQIWIKSIQLRGTLILDPTADADSVSVAYLALILDTQCNGANPAITDVFTSDAMGLNFINLANDKRFRILKRWKWSLSSTAGVTTAYNPAARVLEYYKRCNIPITYDATADTGSIATTRQNSIFLAQGSAVDNQIIFTGAARVRYTG